MPPKRIWIPILCLLILSGLIYYVYQQLPNRARHNHASSSTGASFTGSGLDWLKCHQSNDGRWSARYYQFYCDEKDAKTEELGEFCAAYDSDISYASLAMVAFLSAGYDHKTPGKYKQTVESGIQWLLRQQSDNGWFSSNNREQALACMVLAEAYAMTMDPQLTQPTQLAFNQLRSRLLHNPFSNAVVGWAESEHDQDYIDFSVTAWAVMAAKAIKSSGSDAGELWDDFKESYQQAWIDQQTVGGGNQAHFAQRLNLLNGKYEGVDDVSTSLAIIFLGRRPGDAMMDALHASVVKTMAGDLSDFHGDTVYMASLVIYQYGGQAWADFNKKKRALVSLFSKVSTCEEGSASVGSFRDGNKFLDTVFLTLISEVRSHYQRVKPREATP